jgi:hypothetical protein
MRERINVCITVGDENTSTEGKDDDKDSIYEESVCEIDQLF